MVVTGTDTNLLVMLVAGAPSSSNVYQIKQGHRRVQRKVFRESAIQETIGNLKDNLLFPQAVTGK